MDKNTLLLIDKDPVSVYLLERQLKKLKPEVLVHNISSGHESLLYLQQHECPEYVVISNSLLESDARYFLTEYMASEAPCKNIFLLTSQVITEEYTAFLKHHSIVTLRKPITESDVRRMIDVVETSDCNEA